MPRTYLPWTPRPTPRFRGPAALLAVPAVLAYRAFGPIVRRFPAAILVAATLASGFVTWAIVLGFQQVASVDRHLATLHAAQHGAAPIRHAWSIAQLNDGARQLGLATPGALLWPLQSVLVRDVIALVGIIIFVSLVAVVGIWGERKVAGRMQSRCGPMRVGGWHGWSQSVADGIKLLTKEDIVPAGADGPLFRLAPYLAFVPALAAFVALPFAGYWVFRDLDVGLLFILATLGIEVMGVILAGWASNNKWSLFGGMREACQVISYEIPMGLSLLIPVMIAESLRFSDIAARQEGGWFTWLAFHSPWAFVAMFTYFISSLASCKRAPFDLPEGESELVSGFHTEYSGFRWSLFFFAEYAAMFAVSGVVVILFLGAWHAPWPAPEWLTRSQTLRDKLLYGLLFSGPVWFILKSALLVYLQMWLRWTLPRIRIDQVLYSCVQVMLPLVMVMLLCSVVWEYLLASGSAWMRGLTLISNVALGGIGILAVAAVAATVTYGFTRRRALVGTLVRDLMPGA